MYTDVAGVQSAECLPCRVWCFPGRRPFSANMCFAFAFACPPSAFVLILVCAQTGLAPSLQNMVFSKQAIILCKHVFWLCVCLPACSLRSFLGLRAAWSSAFPAEYGAF